MNTSTKKLIEAEKKALLLFQEIEKRGLIIPGKTEKKINTEIYNLAFELFGIKLYWHKRIVRAGKNTLKPYNENPENLTLQKDDILFIDFGPIFEEWEADFGRTYVIGKDPYKLKLKNDIELAWHKGKTYFENNSDLTGAQLYDYCVKLASDYGWEFGGQIAGHLIGQYPHEKLEKENKSNYIHPNNFEKMLINGLDGKIKNWILEIHFIDRNKKIGGFFEQLLF